MTVLGRLRVIGALALCPALIASLTVTGTRAAWNDSEYVYGAIQVGVVPPPGALSCSGGGTYLLGGTAPNVTFTWGAAVPTGAASLAAAGYDWTLALGTQSVRSGTTTPGARSAVITGAIPGGTYTFSVVTRETGGMTSVPGPTGTYVKTDALALLLGSSGCSTP